MTTSTLTVTAFVALTAAAFAVNHRGRRADRRWPAIGDVFSVLATGTVGRVLVMLGWWWLGWHFFVR
jgi:Family of unknown function (DUF6186)